MLTTAARRLKALMGGVKYHNIIPCRPVSGNGIDGNSTHCFPHATRQQDNNRYYYSFSEANGSALLSCPHANSRHDRNSMHENYSITKNLINMKRNLLKTLLVAVGMVVGMNAWAAVGDVTTNVDIDFSNAITDGAVAGTKGSMTIGTGDGYATTITDGVLYVGNAINTVTIPQDERAKEKDIVVFTFEMGTADGKDNYGAFNMKDADGNIVAELVYAHWEGTAGSINKTNLGITLGNTVFYKNKTNPKDVDWSKRTLFTITFDYKNKTITTVTQINGSKALDPVTVSMSNTNSIAEFNLYSGTTSGGGGEVRRPKFDNLKVTTTEGDYTTQTADYTIKYLCNGVEVKEASKRTGDVGATIEFLPADKENFFSEDGLHKYIYVNDDLTSSTTIAADGTTVITVNFREAEKYTYTLKSSLGTTLKEGSDWEGETIQVNYPRYLTQNSTLYSTEKGSNQDGWYQKTIILNQNNKEETINYTAGATGIVFLSEAEDIETLTVSTAANSNVRCSNGLGAYNAGEDDALIVNLPSGKYKLYTSTWGGTGVDFTFKAGDTTIGTVTCLGYIQDYNTEEFVLSETSTPITLGATTNAARCIDFIYIQKTGEAEEEVAVGDAGLATYTPSTDLDFTNATKIAAYKASVSGNEVTLTKVTTVAKEEGVLLRSIEGGAVTENIAVAATATKNEGNAFVGTLTDITVNETEGENTNYVLSKENDVMGFYKAAVAGTKVAAGKAYLPVATADVAKGIKVVFDGETTGISTVKGDNVKDNTIYNLNGQRVAAPAKGLYIMNGKKFIVK